MAGLNEKEVQFVRNMVLSTIEYELVKRIDINIILFFLDIVL